MNDFNCHPQQSSDRFCIHSCKIGGKSVEKYCKKPKAADNNSSSVLKRIQLLPISKKSKEFLSKLVMNHTICDITKLAKISKKSITLHGKVNIKSTGSIVDVIIKVYSDSRKINDKLYAYSRNIYKEEKEILPDVYPNTIDSNSDYLKEHIVYYKDDNIVIIKMFKYCKTIEQMIKSFPNKKNSFFAELLALYGDIKKRDNSLWQNTACTMKNIIWHNGKWIFLSTICCPGYCQRKGMEADNILAIIDLFKSYGMTNEELMNGVKQQMLSNYYFPCIFSQVGFLDKHFPAEKK
ncbi:hypothetical protein ACKWTF_003547 [Chironomus riparius]